MDDFSLVPPSKQGFHLPYQHNPARKRDGTCNSSESDAEQPIIAGQLDTDSDEVEEEGCIYEMQDLDDIPKEPAHKDTSVTKMETSQDNLLTNQEQEDDQNEHDEQNEDQPHQSYLTEFPPLGSSPTESTFSEDFFIVGSYDRWCMA